MRETKGVLLKVFQPSASSLILPLRPRFTDDVTAALTGSEEEGEDVKGRESNADDDKSEGEEMEEEAADKEEWSLLGRGV